MDMITRSVEVDVESFVDGERAVVARINTAGVDRLRTVIDPLGADVTHFNKTRSVLWNHGLDPIRGTVPIGIGWAKVRRSERDMIGKIAFASDEFSETLFKSYKEKTLRGWSIKAGVHEASPPTRDEIRSRPELEECEMIYRKWDLIEVSGTGTPGNSDCLTMLVSRGLITAPEGFVPAVQETVERYITHSGDKWIVHAEDGKVLGEHGDEASAKKQLAAIEAHKHDEERTMPYIEQVDGAWVIFAANGERCMGLRDEQTAQDCLRLMTVEPPKDRKNYYHAEAAQVLAETRRMFGDIGSEIKEYIDLYRHGRV